jgi:hypothetical protein
MLLHLLVLPPRGVQEKSKKRAMLRRCCHMFLRLLALPPRGVLVCLYIIYIQGIAEQRRQWPININAQTSRAATAARGAHPEASDACKTR